MIEGPINHGWTESAQRYMTLYLPIDMPGFGRIEDEAGWMVFFVWMKEEMAAHKRTLDALAQATALDDTDNDYSVRLQEYAVRCLP